MVIGQYPKYLYLIGSFCGIKKSSKRKNSGCIRTNRIVNQVTNASFPKPARVSHHLSYDWMSDIRLIVQAQPYISANSALNEFEPANVHLSKYRQTFRKKNKCHLFSIEQSVLNQIHKLLFKSIIAPQKYVYDNSLQVRLAVLIVVFG